MNNTEGILFAHKVSGVSVDASVEVDGHVHRVRGRSTGIRKLGVPTITILTDGSTPQKREVATDAEENFNDAVRSLVQGGSEFYTVLRPDWNLPAFLWQLELEVAA